MSTDETPPPNAEAEDVKAKFKEVLEQKNKRHQDMNLDAADLERSKAGGPHGPAGGKRTFRRKSG